MKVLMINNNHFLKGGATRAYFDMIKVLENKEHEVAHFSTMDKSNKKSPWEKYFVQYFDLSDSSKYSLFQKLKIILRVWYNFETRKKLRALLEQFKPDVAHLHNVYHHLSPSVIDELKKHNIPVVMTLHDFKIVSPNYDLFCRGKVYDRCKQGKYYQCVLDKCVKDSYFKSFVCMIEAYLHRFLGSYQKVDVFTAPSKFYAQKAMEFGFSRNIEFLSNPLLGITEKEGVTEETSKNEDKKYFLFYGQLSPEKGIENLINAFVEANVPERLLILGDGPLKRSLKKHVAKSEVEKKIEFIPFDGKTQKEIISLQKRAICIVSPSLCYENAPYSVLEAMSLGRVVLCSDSGGAKEMVGDEERGFVFVQGDVEDLSRKLKFVSENPRIRKEKEEKAKKYVLENYSEENFYSSLMNVYKQAIVCEEKGNNRSKRNK